MNHLLMPFVPGVPAFAPPTPEQVRKLEDHLMQMPQVDLQTKHLIHGGMYARTIFIPAGTVLTGALTNVENVFIVHGDITVTTNDGVKRLTGFHVLPATAGHKRAGFAHADTWCTTVVPTDLEEVEAIEDSLTDESGRLQTRQKSINFIRTDQVSLGDES